MGLLQLLTLHAIIRVIGLLSLFIRLSAAQAVDPDTVDFTTIAIWKDLRTCPQYYIQHVPELEGCSTNACICRGSTLGDAIPKLSSQVLNICTNLDDASTAVSILTAYCSAKGYTQIVMPTVLPSTGAFTVTETVTAMATVTAIIRVSDSSPPPASPGIWVVGLSMLAMMATAGTPFAWMLYRLRLKRE